MNHYEIDGHQFKTRTQMLSMMAGVFVGIYDDITAERGQTSCTNPSKLANAAVKHWGLDVINNGRTHMTFNGYTTRDLANAFAAELATYAV